MLKVKPERIKDYLHTLQAVEAHLPATAHSDHWQRLREMQSYFKRLLKAEEG